MITSHYGSYDVLRNFLNSVETHTKGVEIIVVDNDRLPLDFNVSFPAVKLIRSGKNVGYGAACNIGAKLAKGSVLVFMNNDLEVCPNWLKPLAEVLMEPRIGGVCPLVLYRDKIDVVNAAGGDCDLVGLAWRRGMGKSRNANLDGEFFWLTGCCLAIRKEVFNKIGGFDPSFFLFLEDVDLSWRLRIAGYDLAFRTQGGGAA